MRLDPSSGWVDQAIRLESPNCDAREHHSEPEVIIVHCISLPPGEYEGDAISQLFCNQLDPEAHPYFAEIAHLRVSAHFLIRRSGELMQFVPTTLRAWHAGESICQGKPGVNDFSLGIELEGLDSDVNGYTGAQYRVLNQLLAALIQAYPQLKKTNLYAHSDIAPGRKTDPGPHFNWAAVQCHEPTVDQ